MDGSVNYAIGKQTKVNSSQKIISHIFYKKHSSWKWSALVWCRSVHCLEVSCQYGFPDDEVGEETMYIS